ncbi:PQQ-dependent sugar dehydrogenase [Chloroflexota bacterium]
MKSAKSSLSSYLLKQLTVWIFSLGSLMILLTACSGTIKTSTPTSKEQILSPSSLVPDIGQGDEEKTESTQTASSKPPVTTPEAQLEEPTARPKPSEIQEGLPNPQKYTWRMVVDGLESPVALTNAADGSGRLFILEQSGTIKIFDQESLLTTPFLDIRGRVGSESSEQGLLGLAFHPQYPQNGYFFINYTDRGGDTVIARYQVSGADKNIAKSESEKIILTISQPFANHNGGMLAFGPDGYLYAGTGDGGSGGDPLGNGQSLDTLLGKIIRLDIDKEDSYTIPADNPFTDSSSPEIWAYGLRNPWRFTFDSLTGDIYIGDVGQDQWEEINFIPAGSPGGSNFGWNYFEGSHQFSGTLPNGFALIPPIAEYHHEFGCSVTGGVIYRGSQLAGFNGVYLYGDFCTGNVWGALQNTRGDWESALLFENMGRVSSFGEDETGEVYIVDYNGTVSILSEKQ